MDGNLTVFRVFDLAFFAPGIVVLTAILVAFPERVEAATRSPLGKSLRESELLAGVVLVFTIHLLGVAAHGLGRLLREFIPGFRRLRRIEAAEIPAQDASRRAFDSLVKSSGSILPYFWYMRTLCLNLIPASMLLCVAVAVRARGIISTYAAIVVGAMVVALLCYLYRDFEAAYLRAGSISVSHEPESDD
ncbi:MAG: hypothetical protein SFX72_17220 [Isosphaeraceae bacterium]|nr:hypothetical protein [Isosphaeraceae bacterium]